MIYLAWVFICALLFCLGFILGALLPTKNIMTEPKRSSAIKNASEINYELHNFLNYDGTPVP